MQATTFDGFNSSDVLLDGFEFNLDGENDDMILGDSQRSGSSTSLFHFDVDVMKEDITSSLNELTFDVSSDDEASEPVRRPRSNARASRPRQSLLLNSKRFELTNCIDFDPPTANRDRVHIDELSLNSYNTAQTTHRVNNGLQSSTSLASLGNSAAFSLDQYNEALDHLAQTMKRTEESRRQVMLQRALITQQQEQQRQAEELAVQRAQQEMALRRASAIRSNHFSPMFNDDCINNGAHSHSGAASFLMGSSGTLTSGLAQSRRQLQMYMAQMNGQTF